MQLFALLLRALLLEELCKGTFNLPSVISCSDIAFKDDFLLIVQGAAGG